MNLRFLISIFFFFAGTCYFSQQLYLVLKTDAKKSVHGVSYWGNVVLKSKDTTIRYELDTNPGDTIKNIPAGDYIVHLSSMFGQSYSKKISLTRNSTQELSVGKLNRSTKPKILSKKMKDRNILYIVHNTGGVRNLSKIGIQRRGSEYYCYHTTDVYGDSFLGDPPQGRMINLMGADLLKMIRAFEQNLMAKNKTTGCSVVESYTVQLNGRYYTANDGTCEWAGFSKLLKTLFTGE